jgi:hypothetical protein
MIVNKSVTYLTLPFILACAACSQSSAPVNESDALGTMVAATMAAQSTPVPPTEADITESTVQIAATPKSEPPTHHETSMQEFLLAYTYEGDLWIRKPDGSGEQLTSNGDVVDVLLSEDRSLVVYARLSAQSYEFELRAIRLDGGDDRQIISQETLDSLYPLDEALHFQISQVEFIPGSHSLLFNTRATYDAPGSLKNDDLYLLNVDTGELSLVLSRQQGGDFFISPDGEKLAISRADSISMASIDGSGLSTNLVTFQPIITYSEYRYYPVIVWAPGSTQVGVFIPSADPLADEPSGTVWIIPVEGEPRSFPPISGQAFFPQTNGNSLLSPDMQSVAILREGGAGQATMLVLSDPDGSNSRPYAQGDIQWIGWNSDGSHFAFRRDNATIVLGSPQADPQPLASGRSLRWVASDLYVAQAGQRGNWSLMLGNINGTASLLLQLSSESLLYDLR